MLRAQDLLAHAMHAHALEGLGDGRERADDVVVARAPTSCSAQAESLPLDHAIRALGLLISGVVVPLPLAGRG